MSKRGTYWRGTGTHQAEFKRLRTALLTVGGTVLAAHGELLRAVSDLYVDLNRTGLCDIDARWDDWQAIHAQRDRIAAAIGTNGTWVVSVVDRAMTERYLAVGTGGCRPSLFPVDAFESLVDGCVLAVAALHAAATRSVAA